MPDSEHQRAERLDRLIDDIGRGPGGESGLEAGDLAALVALASDLRGLAPERAPAQTRARLRRHVLGRVHAASPTIQEAGWWPRLRPAYALAAAALAVTLVFGTTVAAAAAALPGDALYSVKRGIETARLALSGDDSALMATFADRRVDEIAALTELGRWDDVEAALSEYAQAVDGLGQLDAPAIESQLERHLEALERVRGRAPEPAQAALDRVIERAERGRQEAHERQQGKGTRPEAPGQQKKQQSGASATPGPPNGPRRPGGLPPGWEKKLTPTP